VGGQRHDPAALPPGKVPLPFYRRLDASGPVFTGAENLDPIGIRSPDRQGERTGAYRVLTETPEGKRPVGSPGPSWEDNIKMDLQAV